MNIIGLLKKALNSAFFCVILFYTALFSATPTLASVECNAPHYDDVATVRYVHDGDTVHLQDNRKVRLLGIDTPELGRNGQSAQPYSTAAKNALKALLSKSNNKIKLVFGVEKKDRYGRVLAHIFLESGTNVQSVLISKGLAIAYTTPPNTRFSDCYFNIENTSRIAKRGIWTHTKYQPVDANDLTTETNGFRIIKGIVKKVSVNNENIWISLNNQLNVQIRKKDMQNFDIQSLNCLVNNPIQIRGWLHSKKMGFYLSLRDPSSLQLLSKNSCN